MEISEFKRLIRGRRVGVIGIGVSNLPLIDFLLDCGAVVYARDRKARLAAAEVYERLEKKGARVIDGEGYLDALDEEVLFRSPGIRSDVPQIADAVSRGALLSSETELFFELCPCKIIAVTGSDGKTTTTTLTAKLLQAQLALEHSSRRVYIGGNIGIPPISFVSELRADDYAVVELSSFQLQTMKKSADVAVVTNITPNHLNWHTDMEEYINAKKNVFLHQSSGGRLVINALCPHSSAFAGEAAGVVCRFSSSSKPSGRCGVYEADGVITVFDENGERGILRTRDIKIPGRHNVENYMAAIGATAGLLSPQAAEEVAVSFGGVEHRIEFVRELDGVRYFNSSIDSSPTRTIAALRAFDTKLVVILGGYDKNIPYEPLVMPLFEHARAVVLTGATADKLYEVITGHEKFGDYALSIYREALFEDAVNRARAISSAGDTVILSPAAASFDAFANFEQRGRAFKNLVENFK